MYSIESFPGADISVAIVWISNLRPIPERRPNLIKFWLARNTKWCYPKKTMRSL